MFDPYIEYALKSDYLETMSRQRENIYEFKRSESVHVAWSDYLEKSLKQRKKTKVGNRIKFIM